jgi:thermitase
VSGKLSRRATFGFLALAAMTLPAAGARAGPDVCVIVDPVVALGCGEARTDRPVAESSDSTQAAAGAASDQTVNSSPTTVEHDPGHIGVMVAPGTPQRRLRAVFARAGVEVETAIPAIESYLLRVDPAHQAEAVRILNASQVVVHAGEELVAHALDTTPDDAEWPQQAGLRLVGFPRAWDTSRGSAQVTVAVVDTGVDPGQPDLRGAVVGGANFVAPSAPPVDDRGHGTAVAGIIAARSNNLQGMAGICWFCSVMPVKVLDASGSGDDTAVAAGIVWAADHGADVINLSLGAPGQTPELTAALTYAAGKGVVVIAAAGNSGTTVPFFPAADVSVLSVAGTTTLDRPYTWSNYGPWVDVTAPGCNIAPLLRGGYGGFCGTSSATPIVAGLAALALSTNPTASVSEILQAIEDSATPLPGFVRFGRVDAPRALALLRPAGSPLTSMHEAFLTRTHPARSYKIDAGPGQLTATIRFGTGRTLSLAIAAPRTRAGLARIKGPSPLELTRAISGPVTVTVRLLRGTSARFVLTLRGA